MDIRILSMIAHIEHAMMMMIIYLASLPIPGSLDRLYYHSNSDVSSTILIIELVCICLLTYFDVSGAYDLRYFVQK